jgi:hypothetical protein
VVVISSVYRGFERSQRSVCNKGVIPSEAAFQAKRRISRDNATITAREIPRPAGESAGDRDDAAEDRDELHPSTKMPLQILQTSPVLLGASFGHKVLCGLD